VRLADGSYVGGHFGTASYAARFPHDGDLYLDEVWPVRADGAFGDESLGYGLYVPAATISSIDVVGALPAKEMAHG
jgi:hypothetical protein